MKNPTLKLAPVFALCLLGAGCGLAPDINDKEVVDAIRETATAKGGVCPRQAFTWLAGARSYGVATVSHVDRKSGHALVEVLSHKPSSRWSWFSQGDSKFGETAIKDLAVKADKDCGFKP